MGQIFFHHGQREGRHLMSTTETTKMCEEGCGKPAEVYAAIRWSVNDYAGYYCQECVDAPNDFIVFSRLQDTFHQH